VENGDHTVTPAAVRGRERRERRVVIVLDASTGEAADRLGVNRSQKLANAAGTTAVQHVHATLADVVAGRVDFPATVDFSPVHQVGGVPAGGFPAALAVPGAVGRAGYSPLIELRDGTGLNAPQIANASGRADKVVALDPNGARGHLPRDERLHGRSRRPLRLDRRLRPARGHARERHVRARAQRRVRSGRRRDRRGPGQSRGVHQRPARRRQPEPPGPQLGDPDGLDPLNVLRWNPSQGRYSPLWDVHLAQWAGNTPGPVQTDWNTIQGLVDHGRITGPGGASVRPAGFIVDCPIIFRAG
jgi:hypothetical protein